MFSDAWVYYGFAQTDKKTDQTIAYFLDGTNLRYLDPNNKTPGWQVINGAPSIGGAFIMELNQEKIFMLLPNTLKTFDKETKTFKDLDTGSLDWVPRYAAMTTNAPVVWGGYLTNC